MLKEWSSRSENKYWAFERDRENAGIEPQYYGNQETLSISDGQILLVLGGAALVCGAEMVESDIAQPRYIWDKRKLWNIQEKSDLREMTCFSFQNL